MGFDPQRGHATVKHSKKEWTRDDDGDGIREVHFQHHRRNMDRTEKFPPALPFFCWLGVCCWCVLFVGFFGGGGHKKNLAAYVAIFEWTHNLKRVTAALLRTLMIPGYTYFLTLEKNLNY
ncbi:MAG: hypothetical protein QF922_01395 [SAR324 cluster bacterium]|jgi:hypothetical protein|nr:hypothetical protein [SAR324 cluster bacterium]